MKHNFYKLKKSNTPLPPDVNEPVEKALMTIFKCPELQKELDECRAKRRFCELSYSRDGIGCEIQFVNGIVINYFLIGKTAVKRQVPGRDGFVDEVTYITHRRSVKNEALSYPKDNEL